MKHENAISVHVGAPRRSGSAIEHLRAQVAPEERHTHISGRLPRGPYRGADHSPGLDGATDRQGAIVTYLDDAMPVWHWCETYGRRVDAPPQDALAALFAVTLDDMAVTRLLMTVRDLPGALVGRRRFDGLPGEGPLIDRMLDFGFCNLGENPDREMSVGLIDQSWKLDGGERAQVKDIAEFTAYHRPGFVKIGANFLATPHDGGTFLSTQTRPLATDEPTRRIFGAYWVFIRPFSGLTRKAWLEATQRRLDE